MRHLRNLQILSVILFSVSSLAWSQGGRNGRGAAAQQAAPPTNAAGRGGRGSADFFNYDPTASGAPPIGDSQPAETHQKITVNGQALAYTTHAGYLALHDATSGTSQAHLFFTYYAKDGEGEGRPLMVFLGGAPGVATAWQEFGGFGPKRMKLAGDSASTPYVENTGTLLGKTDLVFVNPVGTGFSRPDQPAWGLNFWNTTADIASLGAFVRNFVGKYNRAASPLFLAGEDRGTARVAGLAVYLNEHQIPVQGVVLLSMMESMDSQAGDAQYITLLPSLVMASWHHKKLSPEMNAMSAEQIAGQARQFASREYLHALYNGDRMTAEERTKVIADLSRLTGLSKAFLVSNNLRITLDRFNGELLKDQQQGLSYSDARVSGFLPRPAGGRGGGGGRGFGPPPPPMDLNLNTLSAGFLKAYDGYLRHELSFTGNANGIFYLLNGGVGAFTVTGADDASLATAFAANPNLHLFVGVSYFDLNAPFYATEFTLAHLNVSPEVRAHNISVSHYEAGQMAYTDSKALVKLQRDLGSFIDSATATPK